MPEGMLIATLRQAHRHPWFKARAQLVLAILRTFAVVPPASIIEVGCGGGMNLCALERAGYRVVGLDVSRRILELIDRPERHLIEADLNLEVPPSAGVYDCLLALDVLEHIDDDKGAAVQLARLLRPEGIAVISVPALPELFCEFDSIQGHRRRYLPDTLREAFVGTELQLRRMFWWGAWMVPLFQLRRRGTRTKNTMPSNKYADYLRLPPWPVPLLMSLAFALEKHAALNGKLRIGTSLFAVLARI